jgi:HAE1 family hydrophobic/amphiphilic exporter-1
MWLTNLAITRPVTICMLVLALIIMGLQSRGRLAVDLLPDIAPPLLMVSTAYTGASPEEMETLITEPIEEAVGTISGLKEMSSNSSEGRSFVRLEFEIGTNLDTVIAEVRSRLDALRRRLPEEAEAPTVFQNDADAEPILQVSVASTKRSARETRELIQDLLEDQLAQVPGVAGVEVTGGDVREILVQVDPSRLAAYGLSIGQVIDAIERRNTNIPSGQLKESRRSYSLRVMGEFTSVREIEEVIITAPRGGRPRVRELATVRDTIAERSSFNRLNNNPSITIAITKQSDANTVAVAKRVRERMFTLTGDVRFLREHAPRWAVWAKPPTAGPSALPDDLRYEVLFDQSIHIKETLDDVYRSLVEGALLAVLIVFLFLHTLRGTFIVALAIPTSIIATFLVMDGLNFSLNMMSMMGLSLSVGILVDDSIVVLENIHRHLQMGKPLREAAIAGRTEIGLAAMTITLVDVVVFLPVSFVSGVTGQIFREFGITVAVATLFSLFISFTLTPMLASRILETRAQEAAHEAQSRRSWYGRFVGAWERGYERLRALYAAILVWALASRAVVITLGAMTLLASLVTTLPKPDPELLTKGLPVLVGAGAVLWLLWWPVRFTRGGWRLVVWALLMALTLWVIRVAAERSGTAPTMMPGLLLIVGLAGMAYHLSRPAPRRDTLLLPLVLWAALLYGVCLLLPTSFRYEFTPPTDQRQLNVMVEHEVGTPLEVTNRTITRLEEHLLDHKRYPEIERVLARGGGGGRGMFGGAERGRVSVELDAKYTTGQQLMAEWGMIPRQRTTDEIVALINEAFGRLPAVRLTASPITSSVDILGTGNGFIRIRVSGKDMPRILEVANAVQGVLSSTEGVFGPRVSWQEARPELGLTIDSERAAQYGLTIAQVARAVRATVEGDTSVSYREGGREYDIRIRAATLTEGEAMNLLPRVVVATTATGQAVYLYDVVALRSGTGPARIERINRQRAVTVFAFLAPEYSLGNVKGQIDQQLTALNATGVTIAWSGQAEQMEESFTALFWALALSITLVFMLMSALFESVLSPFIIMLAVPQAMAGALFALTLTDKSLCINSIIGIIMLVGLVTKNAILLVDYTNNLRQGGMDRRAALLQAGQTRLRPILMTTLAMIGGMLPTAIALNAGAEMRQPMAIAVIGGLLLAMFLTLMMVPTFYEIVDDVVGRFRRRPARVVEVPAPGAAAGEVDPTPAVDQSQHPEATRL